MKWSSLLGLRESPPSPVATPQPRARHRFSTAIGDDYQTWKALVAGSPLGGRVARADAMRIPAIVRARNLVCATVGTLPLFAFREPGGERIEHPLLHQPERLGGLTRSVTLTNTCADLFFDAASLWLVVTRTSTGFPESVERVPIGLWTVDSESGVIRVRGNEVESTDVILFTSPCEPLLVVGANAMRALLRLEQTVSLYIDTPEASHYFTADDDPEDDDEVSRFLNDWQNARKQRAVAYVPAALRLSKVDRLTPEEMGLIGLREFAVGEIARLTGIDPSWLGLSITTRQYSNIVDERRSFIDLTLAPYLRCIEERLSLGDVTPRGQRVKWNLDAFMRANTTERYAAYSTALTAGFLTLDEVRALEDRTPLSTVEDSNANG